MIQRAPPGTQAVERALALLKAVGGEGSAPRLVDLAERTGLHRATARRLLGALEREGLVARTGERYRLGPEALALGARARDGLDLRGLARPVLATLAREAGETATLEALAGAEVTVLDEVPGGGVIGASVDVGSRWPAHTTSTGKALLAALPPEGRPALTLARRTPHTITGRAAFAAELARTARRGFGVAREELELGYVAVGAVVRDDTGAPVAALSLGGPASRFGAARTRALAATVRAAADGLSTQLGYAC